MRQLLLIFCLGLLPNGRYLAASEFPSPRRVDERRAAAVGIRKIVGRHLRLYTDLPPSDAVDSLAAVFDAAVPLWADYFEVEPAKLSRWRMQGFLMQDRAKFATLGLLPEENRDFANGYSNGYELWVVEQSSDYFRRHLLLHEGTHGFMYTQLGDTGTGWYMEGMAELLGTHRWQDGKLDLRVMPAHRADVPMWGRIKLVRDATQTGEVLGLRQLMAIDKRRAFSTGEYAWCWALCEFFDSHPRWQETFRNLKQHVTEPRFNKRVRYEFRKQWPDVQVEWQAYVAALDYGYDAERMTMQHRPSRPTADGASVSVEADRGWQSTGWQLSAGTSYELMATGRYEIARESAADGTSVAWPCEPGGVTLQYHAGRPLGMLLGAWRETKANRFSAAFPIGPASTLKPPTDAVLYLRVNDSPAKLSDNRGTLDASIRRVDDSAAD